MGYCGLVEFQIQADESIAEAVRRIAHEETAMALQDLRSPEILGPVKSVHDCRKRCKKARSLIRLVRDAFGNRYRPTNTAFRDAGRELSAYRDAHALLATFDSLVAVSANGPQAALTDVRAELARRSAASTEAVHDAAGPFQRAITLLETVQADIDQWKLKGSGWDSIDGGIARTYTRGRDRLAEVQQNADVHTLHILRKRAKYTWHHLRLLESAAPSVLTPLALNFNKLSDGLGDAHDLAVLQAQLRDEPDTFGGPESAMAVHHFLDDQRIDLEQASMRLAAAVYQESPQRWSQRIGGYWNMWHELGEEQPVGAIKDLHEINDDLGALSVSQLRLMAREQNIPGRSSLRQRRDLLGAIRVHQLDNPPE